jgi:hypothetical protein
MANKPIPGFKSFETRHCYTGSMKHIYEFYGYPISGNLSLALVYYPRFPRYAA